MDVVFKCGDFKWTKSITFADAFTSHALISSCYGLSVTEIGREKIENESTRFDGTGNELEVFSGLPLTLSLVLELPIDVTLQKSATNMTKKMDKWLDDDQTRC